MLYRPLGKSMIEASIIGLGTHAFGGSRDSKTANDRESLNAIHAALDSGVTLIDTAPSYGWGHCERIIGRAIKGRRDEAVIATKCGVWWQDARGSFNGIKDGKENYVSLRPDTIKIEVENSLKNLGTDYIDLLQCHKPAIPPEDTPIPETMGCLMSLKDQGKIRAIGVSNVSLDQFKTYDSVGELSSNQFRYSMLHRDREEDILAYAAKHDIATLTYWSLEAGLLAGKVNVERVFEKNDFRNQAAQWHPWYKKENIERLLDVFVKWSDILNRHECTLSQLVIAWTAAQPGASHVLCGAKTAAQSEQNAAAGSLVLEPDEIDRIRDDLNALGDPI